ncbi:hypothetical protein VTH06DRAFT_4272 [Thermothelomyces fergusii]
MSAESVPITPERFAAALKELPLVSLHLKVQELRNSIAHLDYSNEQLRPFAEGRAPAAASAASAAGAGPGTGGVPDPDCADAIRENEVVIERMQERIRLVRAEVESRGLRWSEFALSGGEGGAGAEEDTDTDAGREREREGEGGGGGETEDASPLVNGTAASSTTTTTTTTTATATETTVNGGPRHPAWLDGTFQTGVIRDGVLRMHADPARQGQARQGGSLSDEELRRRVEEQLRGLGDDDDDGEGGLHL